MGYFVQEVRAIVMKHDTLLTEFILIFHFRYVSSLSPHMITCTKYPIGSKAWWEVLCIFSCCYGDVKARIQNWQEHENLVYARFALHYTCQNPIKFCVTNLITFWVHDSFDIFPIELQTWFGRICRFSQMQSYKNLNWFPYWVAKLNFWKGHSMIQASSFYGINK